MSAKGIKFDETKPDFSLIPVAALMEEARCWSKGKVKYAAFNWHQGLLYRRILAAVGRHWALLNAGIDIDPETQCHHAAAIRCGMGMLITFHLEERLDLDDRMQMSAEAKRKIEAMSQGEMIWNIIDEEQASKDAVLEASADANELRPQDVEALYAKYTEGPTGPDVMSLDEAIVWSANPNRPKHK